MNPLTVAVTGPTGTFGHGLLPLLEADPRIGRVVGIARSPFDPAAQGWAKLEYRRGDVRDRAALEEAFAGADAVVHLAFIVVGGSKETTRTINVEGTLNAFRAAAAAGVRRFVYASSVAAYGFHPDNPDLIREEWPTRPATRLRYAQEKAELEALLLAEHAEHPALELYLLRPPVVVGPHTVGGKAVLPGPLAPLNRYLEGGLRRVPVPLPALLPDLPLQLVHEDDVGRALLQCVLGAGPPGAYNIAGDGVLSALDVARELGLVPIPLPPRPVQAVARLVARWGVVPQTGWAEVLDRPPLMDTTKAKELLGWRPAFTGLDALRATLDR
ncbi:MAG TPA: NAD-dependent epimerase/dehydratase family protein [Mycobacteriales bacterium]|nr:NAD-dependent epimerase/dehydratase family protein [Mycobacteriales bacterium]